MKIAVASSNGTSISQHFGQSACFIVFEIEDGEIKGREVRDNTYTAHAQGKCQGHEEHGHHDQHHSHSAVIEALHDCAAVLCCGMGARAAQDLAAKGIKPCVVPTECTPESAVSLFLAGKLQGNTGGFCNCHGH